MEQETPEYRKRYQAELLSILLMANLSKCGIACQKLQKVLVHLRQYILDVYALINLDVRRIKDMCGNM